MVNVQTRADGVVVYWTLPDLFNRDTLKTHWDTLGLGEFVPEQRAAISCLKEALQEVFGSRDALIRPLVARNGFSVVREQRGEDENEYRNVLTVKVYSKDTMPVFLGDHEKIEEVKNAFYRHVGWLPSQQVASALVRVLSHLGATRLRPTGGIYWLPGYRVEEWKSVMVGVEAAAHGGTAVGYTITHDLNPESVKAIQDAIVAEVSTEAKRLVEEISSGELGNRAVKTRKEQAAELRRKVADYEEMLDVNLSHLRKALDNVDQANAVAALLMASEPESSEAEFACLTA